MTAAAKPAKKGGNLFKDKRALIAVAAVGLLLVYYLRSRSSASSTSSAVDPNAVDPATGMTYAQEQAAAAASAGGGTISGNGAAGATATSDQIPVTAGGISVAAALEGLASGLGAVQTQQAQDEANAQSTTEAAAQTAQAYSEVNQLATSLTGALGSLVGYITTTKPGSTTTPTPPAPAAPPPPAPPGPVAPPDAPPPASAPETITVSSYDQVPASPAQTYVIPGPGTATPPTYGITTGPPAGKRGSSNPKQGVYTIH